jgi:hypothetical protein
MSWKRERERERSTDESVLGVLDVRREKIKERRK